MISKASFIVELFFNSGAQKSSIEVKETSIRQRVGINGLNMSYTEQSLSGIRIWGENSGILRDRFEVRTDNYVRAIKFNDYPSNRNDNITPLNFLHTNNTGELISSPVGAIRGDFEKVNFDINNINKLVIIDENLLQRFGTFPSITVFMLSSSNNYELFTTSIIYDAFPPTQIDVYLGGGIEGFIIIK